MKKKLLLFIVPLLMAGGCSDYLDVNHSLDALEEIPSAEVLLPTAQVNIGSALMNYQFGIQAGMWVQYWTAMYTHAQFKATCEYADVQFDNGYHNLYTGALVNLKAIKDMSAGLEAENPAAAGAFGFIAEALSIFSWQIATDVWGNIPYSEALQGSDNLSPKFDGQQSIYADLNTRIDALLTQDVSGYALPSTQFDLVYGGDMDAWYSFVTSLKIKLMLRLSETTDFKLDELKAFVDKAIADETLLVESAALPRTLWDDAQEGKRYPLRELQQGGAGYFTGTLTACKSIYDYLKNNADPRLATLFSGGSKAPFFGDHNSTEDSDGDGTKDDEEYLNNKSYALSSFSAATAPAVYMDLMFMSTWEVYFYVAEVFARKGEFGYAKEYYEAGVEESLAQQGITATDIIETGGYAEWTATTEAEAIAQIGMQRWVANCNYQHIESHLERNRTKIPTIWKDANGTPVEIAANRIGAWASYPPRAGLLTISGSGYQRTSQFDNWLPASPLYPTAVSGRNSNFPGQKTNVGKAVWWDQKKEK
jgi:hypothetical protein